MDHDQISNDMATVGMTGEVRETTTEVYFESWMCKSNKCSCLQMQQRRGSFTPQRKNNVGYPRMHILNTRQVVEKRREKILKVSKLKSCDW